MKRLRWSDSSIRSCKIDSNLETNLTSSKYIVQEWLSLLDHNIFEINSLTTCRDLYVITGWSRFLYLIKINFPFGNKIMISGWFKLITLNFDNICWIFIGYSICIGLNHVPFIMSSLLWLAFTFINGFEFSRRSLSINNKENIFFHGQCCLYIKL